MQLALNVFIRLHQHKQNHNRLNRDGTLFFTRGGCVSCLRVRFGARLFLLILAPEPFGGRCLHHKLHLHCHTRNTTHHGPCATPSPQTRPAVVGECKHRKRRCIVSVILPVCHDRITQQTHSSMNQPIVLVQGQRERGLLNYHRRILGQKTNKQEQPSRRQL